MKVLQEYAIDTTGGLFPRSRRWAGYCEHSFKHRTARITIDLGRNWYKATRRAEARHRNVLDEFVKELVDSVVHEYAHALQPRTTALLPYERLARRFAYLVTGLKVRP